MKPKRKTLGFLFLPLSALVLSVATFAGSSTPAREVTADPESSEHSHEGYTAWTSTNSLPNSDGSYYLTNDVTLSSTWYVPSNVNLCLNGYGIKKSGGLVITIPNNRTLNLYDCGMTTHKFSVSSPRDNGAGLAVVDDNLTSGYKTFTGGYITGGTGTNGASLSISGNFNMYGGNIIGNNCGSGDGNGSIRMYSPGVFNMHGGSISYNFGRSGGALFVESGCTFSMYGGLISYNNTSVRAGAIFTRGKTYIRGGEITGNFGGEATIAPWGDTIEVTGGEIHDNIVGNSGLSVANTFRMGGNPNLHDNKRPEGYIYNVVVNSGNTIKIVSAFDEDVRNHPIPLFSTAANAALTSGWSTYMANKYAPYYFKADNEVPDGSTIGIVNGEVALGNFHVHQWEYSVSGNTIAAHCTASGCTHDDQTISIAAQDKTYDGTPVNATISASSGWVGSEGLDIPEIVYSGNTEIGKHTASITVGGVTASTEFEIAPNHEWSYSAEGNVVTAVCTSDHDCNLPSQTLTIHAEDKVYDGQPVTATFEYSDGWTADNGLVMPTSDDIVYTNNTEIGEYTASITIDGAIASTNFFILHGHEWSYSVNGNVITATCVGHGDCDLQSETMTLVAEDKAYDGTPVSAHIDYSEGWTLENGLVFADENSIVYSGNTDVGTYHASLTYQNVTAIDDFTIAMKVEKEVDVSSDLDGLAVEGLDAESQAVAALYPDANEVKVAMKVETKAEEETNHADEIREEAGYARLQFFSAVVTKTVDGQTSTMDETSNVLEIAMPYAYANKRDIVVYSYHDDAIVTFVRNDTRENGTFRVDAENNTVYIYTNRFSTFAISYTPYYNINVNVSLGSYEGTANVTLENIDSSATFVQENIAMGNVKFENVAIGIYRLTISWVDGHSNSITRLISVGGVAIPTNL